MKVALIAITSKSASLVQALVDNIGIHIDIYTKSGNEICGPANKYDCLHESVSKIWHQYDGYIFVMPTSMAVRVIAPCIRDKRFEPAVVVIDEAGKHVVSLLDGHNGGADKLALLSAKAVNAQPIITTTGTDPSFIPAADVLAIKLDLSIEPFDQLQQVNAMIANRDRVEFFIDNSLTHATDYRRLAAELGVVLKDIEEVTNVNQYDAAVVISDKQLYMVKPHVYLRPATLAVGLECGQNISSAEILTALGDACRKIGRSTKSIAVIATSVLNQDVIGLLATVQQLEIPIEFFTSEQVLKCSANRDISEAAALCAGAAEELLLSAASYPNVTVAIAEVNFPGQSET